MGKEDRRLCWDLHAGFGTFRPSTLSDVFPREIPLDDQPDLPMAISECAAPQKERDERTFRGELPRMSIILPTHEFPMS
jgi:hypothetical protein